MVHFIEPTTRNGPGEYAISRIRQPMSNTAAASFYFVNASGNDSPGDDEVTRIQIRRQAMSRAAAARKKGKQQTTVVRLNNPKSNAATSTSTSASASASTSTYARPTALRPIRNSLVQSKSPDNAHEIDQEHDVPWQNGNVPSSTLTILPRKMTSTGYEFMRMQQGFDIMDLSSFTAFHINRGAFRFLVNDPSRLIDLMRQRQWSFLSFLPSRFGSSQCLDDACLSIGARLQQWVREPQALPDHHTVALHSKALVSLRTALADPAQRLSADTLCATQIMSLYELLNQHDDKAWAYHAGGITSLIRLRGPHRYESEYEKALLLAHAGPIFSQSFVSENGFFLDEDAWRDVFKSAILEDRTFSFRSEISLSLWDIICFLPNFCSAITSTLGKDKPLDEERRNSLMARGREIRQSLIKWNEDHCETVPLLGQGTGKVVPGTADKRFEPLGLYINCRTTVNRLMVALNPAEGAELECESQSLAVWFLALEKEANTLDSRVGLSMTLKNHVPLATVATKFLWKELLRRDENGHSNVSVSSALQEWFRMIAGGKSFSKKRPEKKAQFIS